MHVNSDAQNRGLKTPRGRVERFVEIAGSLKRETF